MNGATTTRRRVAVEADHFTDPVAEKMPVRLGEIVGLVDADVHAAGGKFVQVGFPEVRARALDQRHVRPVALAELVAEARRELEPTGAAADDDHAVQAVASCRHARRRRRRSHRPVRERHSWFT